MHSQVILPFLEDEHGLIDVILRPSVAERYRALLHTSIALRVTGMLQREGDVTSRAGLAHGALQVPGVPLHS